MNCAWLFLSSLLYLAVVEYGEVSGLALDDLDFARSAIDSAAKSITSKPVVMVSGKRSKSIKSTHGHTGLKGWVTHSKSRTSTSSRRFRFRMKARPKKVTTKKVATSKPRNLNKFNEAMDQVERAMAQAELSGKTVRLTDLRKDINKAVNRGNVR